jgi:nickel transport protein
MADSRKLLLLLVALFSSVAEAHLLKVFAFAEDDQIMGRTYFVGGAPAAGASVQVLDIDEQLLASLKPDANGEFSYQPTSSIDHIIVANTGDGHEARWVITAEELTGGLPSPPSSELSDERELPDTSQLTVLVEQAVARQVRPLREELIAYEEQVRFRDVIGGIGYILGIFGVVAWWQQKRRSES